MNQLVKFLEKYVEWLVMGLAVIWILCVAFFYWVQQPVQVVGIDGSTQTPAEVDAWAMNNLVSQWKQVHVKPIPPNDQPPDLNPLAGFLLAMKGPSVPNDTLAIAAPAKGVFPEIKPSDIVVAKQDAVLPEVAPPIVQGGSSGKSKLLLPASLLAGGPAPATVLPVLQGAAAPAAPVPPPPPVPTDVIWNIASFSYDSKAQLDALQKAKVPAFLFPNGISVLRVELHRQECSPDGTPIGPDVVVNEYSANPLPAYPAANNPAAQNDYLKWASEHQAEILMPAFYPLGEAPAGDVMWTIMQGNPNTDNIISFNPASPHAPPYTEAEEDQLKAYQAAQKKKAEDDKLHRPPVRQPTRNSAPQTPVQQPSIPEMPRGHGKYHSPLPPAQSFAPAMPLDGAQFADDRPPPYSAPNRAPMGSFLPPVAPPENPAVPPAPGTPPATGAAGAKFDPAPTKSFDPSLQKDFAFYAYDIGIVGQPNGPQPGHTYRYRAVIKMQNPLFSRPQVAANPKDADQFEIDGTSDWTLPITTPRLRHFFVADNGMAGGIKIDVYEWKAGRWTVHSLPKLQAGDPIGDTGAVLIDLRPDWRGGESRVAIIGTEDGRIEHRTEKGDEKDPVHMGLRRVALKITAIPSGDTMANSGR